MSNPSNLRIQDHGNELLVTMDTRIGLWLRLLAAGFGALGAALAASDFFHPTWPLTLLVALLAGLSIFMSLPGSQRAQLRMNARECVTTANFSKVLSRGRTVLNADIRWLEYGDQELLANGGDSNSGLYAVKLHGSVCLLPLLEGAQTMQVIAAIEQKFPGLAEAWRGHSFYRVRP